MINQILPGDCFDIFPSIPDGTIDLIVTDPPYGTTDNSWDNLPDFEKLFSEFRRILKPNGTAVLTCVFPFAAKLILDNKDLFKYDMVWQKNRKTDFANAKNKPLRQHENILVFSKGTLANGSKNKMTYIPQGTSPCTITRKAKEKRTTTNYGHGLVTAYTQTTTGYPSTLLSINCVQKTVHPTEKPTELMEWLIKTLSNEGETVLDPFVGSGSTIVACINTKRTYIGIEKEPTYFETAQKRVDAVLNDKPQA